MQLNGICSLLRTEQKALHFRLPRNGGDDCQLFSRTQASFIRQPNGQRGSQLASGGTMSSCHRFWYLSSDKIPIKC